LRIKQKGISGVLKQGESDNKFGREFMAAVETTPAEKLLGVSWRQYLSWFGRMEGELSGEDQAKTARKVLSKANGNWQRLAAEGIRLDETENNGEWIGNWISALDQFTSLEF
jgi:hypothetical protein